MVYSVHSVIKLVCSQLAIIKTSTTSPSRALIYLLLGITLCYCVRLLVCLAAKLVSQLVRLYGCLVLTIHCCFTGFPIIFSTLPPCYKRLLHHIRFLAAVVVVIATSHLRCHLRLLFDLRVVYCFAAATWCVDYWQMCRPMPR